MAAPASEAGGEAQEELLPTISTPTANSSRGEDIGNLGRMLPELSVAACAVDETARTGKALSSPAEGGRSRMAFGVLSPGLMAEPASEAGGEAQEELLPTISTTPTASSPRREHIGKLGRRLAELSVAACAVDVAAQTGKALLSPAEGGRSRRAFGMLSPGLMAEPASEAGGEPQEEELLSIICTRTAISHGDSRFGNLWRRLAELRAAAYAAEAELNTMKREHEEFEKELLVYPDRSQAAIAASRIQALQGTVRRLQDDMKKVATSLENWWEMPTLFDELMHLQDVKGHNYRNVTTNGFDDLDLMTRAFKQISLKSTDSSVSKQLCAYEKDPNYRNDITESEGSLKDLASRVENISAEFHVVQGECAKYLQYHAEVTSAAPEDKNVMFDHSFLKCNENYKRDDESSSTSTHYSDSEDEILNLLTETTQTNYRHMPPEEFSLPEISSLDLPFQFQSKHGVTSNNNNNISSSSDSGSSDKQTRFDEDDEIYSDRGSIGIATDEEEEVLIAEASVCVGDDLEAIELIVKHDEEEVFAQLGMMARTAGAPRDLLLDLRIVLFAKEKHVTTCAVCICDFDTTDRCIRLPCRHIFHFVCIIQWLLAKSTCPVCRASLSNLDSSTNVHEAVQDDGPRLGP